MKESKELPHPAKQMCTAHRPLASTMDLVFAGQDMKELIKIQNIALVTHSLLDPVSSLKSSLESYNMKVFATVWLAFPEKFVMVLYEDFFVCGGWEKVEGFFAGGEGRLERGRQGCKVFMIS